MKKSSIQNWKLVRSIGRIEVLPQVVSRTEKGNEREP